MPHDALGVRMNLPERNGFRLAAFTFSFLTFYSLRASDHEAALKA
jgi:hypothetical protein